MDRFYETVRGEPEAFYRMCMILPEVIENVVKEADNLSVPNDTVIDELRHSKAGSFALSLYMLGFGTYTGFK